MFSRRFVVLVSSLVLLLLSMAGGLWSSGVIVAVVPAAVPVANKLGNASKFQLAGIGFTPTAGNCATWDSSGNMVDSGISTCGGAGTTVNSFNGRTGAVVPATNDYNFNQLAGSLATGQVGTPQGNGSKVQLSTGSTTSNNCVKFDANGNTADAGFSCGAASQNLMYAPFTRVIDGNFSWFNQQTASYSVSNGIIYLTVPQVAGTQMDVRGATAPVGTPWSITIAVMVTTVDGATNSGGGLIVYDSVGGHYESEHLDNSSSHYIVTHCISGANLSNTVGQTTTRVMAGGVTFLKVVDDATNLTFSASADGVSYTTSCVRPLSGFGNTPNVVGFEVNSFNTANNTSMAVLSWVQGVS